MEINTVTSCPLGSHCEEIKDNKLHRCAWFIQLAGTNPATGETVDERGCAMRWLPVLLVENARQQRSTGAAVESFRNEMVNANHASRQLFASAAGLPAVSTVNSSLNLPD